MNEIFLINLSIIGSKDILKHNVEEYIRKVNQLAQNVHSLPLSDQITDIKFITNLDNIIMMSKNIDNLVAAYGLLKKRCILTEIFLSGSFTSLTSPLDITVERNHNNNCELVNLKYTLLDSDVHTNVDFEIIRQLSNQHTFKGIGVQVDLDDEALVKYAKYFSQSYYSPIKNKTHLISYFDIWQKEISNSELLGAIKLFNNYKRRNSEQLRYFIPLFINYINSINYLDFEINGTNIKFKSSLANSIIDGSLFNKISDKRLPTFKSLYFVFLNDIYQNIEDVNVTTNILNKLMKRKTVHDNLNTYLYDNRVLCDTSKKRLMKDLTRISDTIG